MGACYSLVGDPDEGLDDPGRDSDGCPKEDATITPIDINPLPSANCDAEHDDDTDADAHDDSTPPVNGGDTAEPRSTEPSVVGPSQNVPGMLLLL